MSAHKHCHSDLECKIIEEQIARRARYRMEFLKQRTDPCKHSMEAGYVFDPAIQKFVSLKTTQFEVWKANPKTVMSGVMAILPMFVYGFFVWRERKQREKLFRSGKLRYRDRMFKLQ